MNPIARLFVEVGANTNQFQKGMTQVRDNINSVSKQASFFNTTLSNAVGFGLANAATAGITALTNLGKSIVSTGIGFNELEQNSTVAFETMLGSVDKAKYFINDLKQFAKKTPFELPGLIESSQRLLAFGFDAKKIVPMMTNIGDAIAGLGGSPEKMNRVILAFGQIKAKGKLMAGEMMQLTEAGIPAWDMLAKKIGVSIPEAMKMGEKGLIDADTAINAILEGMNKKFGGLMDKQSKGWTGMLSNIKDTFTQVTGRVMKPFFDLGLKGMETLLSLFNSPIFESFISRIESGSKVAANFIGKLGKGIVGLFTGDYKSFFGGMFGGFDKLGNLLKKYENKRFGWLSNFTPKEALTSVNEFINDLKNGGKFLDYWISHTPRLLQPLMKLSIAALQVWRYFAGEGIQATLKKLGSILIGLGTTLAKLVKPFRDALGGLFNQLSSMKSMGFADIFKIIISSVIQAFSGFIEVIKNEFWPSIKSAFEYVFTSLWNYFTTIDWSSVWTTIVNGFNSLASFISSIDWASLGQLVITGFNAIVAYVQSVDWVKVWSSVWIGLSAVGSWISENIVPVFTNFFSWLVSWFTDPGKSQTLYNAITTTWNFLSSWASSIIGVIDPYLTSFFSWIGSWFTDANKNAQLLSGINTTWKFVTEWAGKLINWVSVPLGAFFNWLLSWVTDSNKRSQLWNGVTTTWNWLIQWASSLVNWIAPYLSQAWNWISSWFTDPTKKQALWNALVQTWNVFSQWASNVWTWLQPGLSNAYTTLINWINEQKPGLGTSLDSWRQSFLQFTIDVKNAFNENFPLIKAITKDTATSVSKDIADMLISLGSLVKFFDSNGDGATTVSEWAKLFTSLYVIVARVTAGVVKAVSSMVQALSILKQAISSMTSGNWVDLASVGSQLNDLIANMQGTIIEDLAKWIDPLYWIGLRPEQIQQQIPNGGHATGGNIFKNGATLVGERGPELVNLSAGSRVYDTGQTRGMLQGNNSSRLDVYIHNESKIPIDRNTVKELAQALQRELNLSGNRVVFSN